MKRGQLWILNWRIWLIPVGMGIITILFDLFMIQSNLTKDLGGWAVTVLCIFIATAGLKGVIPVSADPILGAWVAFCLATFAWPVRWIAPQLIHFHV